MNFKTVAIVIIGLFAGMVSAQHGGLRDQSHDFGNVEFWNNDTAWFTITNTESRELVFLPTFYNENFQLLLSDRKLKPGENTRIGIVYYTSDLGKFSETVPVYINLLNDPIKFLLKGNIRSMHPEALTACPIVNAGSENNPVEKIITLEVRDLETDELLIPDDISVKMRNGRGVKLIRNEMEFRMSTSPGSYRVEASKSGYNPYLALITLEPYQKKFIVYLQKKSEDYIPDPPVVSEPEPDPVVIVDTMQNNEHVHPHDIPVVIKPVESPGELNTGEYRLNNIILIVDVSSSMNRGGKYQSLVGSFNVLVDALRKDDIISIISMSSNAELVQPPVGVYEKDSLKHRIAAIKPLGGTNGGAAIGLAYKLAEEHFIDGGNNQVIIATDGIFYGGSLTRREIEDLIARGNEKGIHMSTVAFGSDPKAMMFLENLSKTGGGTFVHVGADDHEENALLGMIKNQSKR